MYHKILTYFNDLLGTDLVFFKFFKADNCLK